LSKACLIWACVGFSLGWYYTFTYYGRSGWPMPVPEALSGIILYYFSVLNVRTEIQAVHWLLMFPLAGLLWVSLLTVTAPFFGGRKTEYGWSLVRMSVTLTPLILPVPVMMYFAGRTFSGFSVQHIGQVALRHANVTPGSWVTPVYVGLGAAALVWQIFLYAKIYEMRGKRAWIHFMTGLILLVIMSAGLASLAAIPLRYWLE